MPTVVALVIVFIGAFVAFGISVLAGGGAGLVLFPCSASYFRRPAFRPPSRSARQSTPLPA